MNKEGFLTELRSRLTGLPKEDLEERLGFLAEMIDDGMEEGLSEEDAVAAIGTVDEVVARTLAETPITKLVKEKMNGRRRPGAWEIVLIVLGFPVWFPLLAAAFAIALSVYAVLWSLVISLWAIDLALAACAIGGIVAAVVLFTRGRAAEALAMLAAALVSAGLAIFGFFACKAAAKGLVALTKKTALWIKSLFVGKEKA
jgi:uncharacterized membrane protein